MRFGSLLQSVKITIDSSTDGKNKERRVLTLLWCLSGRRDSNPRPPAPKAGALAGLRYAPINYCVSKIHKFGSEGKLFSRCLLTASPFVATSSSTALPYTKSFISFPM